MRNRLASLRLIGKVIATTLVLLPSAAQSTRAQQPQAPTRLDVAFSATDDATRLFWSVGPSRAQRTSELTYSDMRRRMYGASVTYRMAPLRPGTLIMMVATEWGGVDSGAIRDSDYLLPDGAESRRSSAEVTGSAAHAVSMAIGWELRDGLRYLDGLTVLLGFTHQVQTIRMQNGIQILPRSTSKDQPLPGLDSRYEPGWTSPWIALRPTLAVGPITMYASTELEFALRYRAKGSWNLREELAQPLSFEQKASGWAVMGSLGASWQVASRVAVFGSVEIDRLTATDGTDITHLAAGGHTRQTHASCRLACTACPRRVLRGPIARARLALLAVSRPTFYRPIRPTGRPACLRWILPIPHGSLVRTTNSTASLCTGGASP